jgi:hypothetical protein
MMDGDAWRSSGFLPPPGGGEFGAGVLNMSPGWFQQSHEVSLFDLRFFYGLFIFSLFMIEAIARKNICLF